MELPKGHTELSRDERPILAIHMRSDPQAWFTVGRGCSRIEAYDECGSMSHVPWIAVFGADDTIIFRTAAEHVGINYRDR